MYLIVSLVFSHLGFWSGSLFLIAPFPDLCLLVPFSNSDDRPFGLYQYVFVVLFIIYTLFSGREFLALFLHVPGIGGIKLSSCSKQLRLNRNLS